MLGGVVVVVVVVPLLLLNAAAAAAAAAASAHPEPRSCAVGSWCFTFYGRPSMMMYIQHLSLWCSLQQTRASGCRSSSPWHPQPEPKTPLVFCAACIE